MAWQGFSIRNIVDELNATDYQDTFERKTNAFIGGDDKPTLPISTKGRNEGEEKFDWAEADLHTLLTNELVCGTATYPRIIQQDHFDDVQLLRKAAKGGQKNSPNLFAGLLFCAKCGKATRLRTQPTKRIVECGDHIGKRDYAALEKVILWHTFGSSQFFEAKDPTAAGLSAQEEKKALLIKQRHSGLVRRAILKVEVGVNDVKVIRRAD